MRSLILLVASFTVLTAKKANSFGSDSNEFDSKHGGRGGHGGAMGPPFLANVTQEARTAFFQLTKNQNQTKGQMKSAIDNWAATYNSTNAVNEFETEMETMKTERRANVFTAVGQLANAISTLNAIEDDQTITYAETSAQIREAIQAMSPELRALVMAAEPRAAKGGKGGKKGKGGMGMGGMGGMSGFGGMSDMGGFSGGQTNGRGGRGF